MNTKTIKRLTFLEDKARSKFLEFQDKDVIAMALNDEERAEYIQLLQIAECGFK